MGDLSSSLYALGYHERISETTSEIPAFVAELRRATFARIYSDDKRLAIFLGRPPRIIKTYCDFQLPSNAPSLWEQELRICQFSLRTTQESCASSVHPNGIEEMEPITYTADTRCSALFSSLKEDILELARRHSPADQRDSARSEPSQSPG